MLIPGFIDIQINGYRGVDFSGAGLTSEKFADSCRILLNHGIAAFLPSIITSDKKVYEKNLSAMAQVIDSKEFKNRILGIHAEGPFISNKTGAIGAHYPRWTASPSLYFFDKMQKWAKGHIKMITIAAELKGAAEFTKELVKQGVKVSLGHQMASYEDVARLADAGASSLTHLGNGMPNQVNRHHNPLLAGLAEKRLSALIIPDGHHIPDNLIKLILMVKTSKKTIITSDASPLAGLPKGEYNLWKRKVIIEDSGRVYDPKNKSLAGSSLTMFKCMNYLLGLKLLTESQLYEIGFYNPLNLLGINPDKITSNYSVQLDINNNKFIITKK